jgi:predicted house-cleaning NTP pyrophosphatase (Maf/HAM1 superfamily)
VHSTGSAADTVLYIKGRIWAKGVQVLGAVPTKQEVIGDWRKLPNEEPCDVYSSLIIIKEVTSKRIRWAGHV